uniref:Uncharacterized protein n=1 Tax=Arion vulgaris TaxID=1028688 RepID=A0A0B6YNX0_9EUPU
MEIKEIDAALFLLFWIQINKAVIVSDFHCKHCKILKGRLHLQWILAQVF